MRNSSSFVRIVVSIAVFVLLETISILLITNNGIVQRYRIVGGVRSIQTSLWRFGENTKAYFNLKETNKYLSEENNALKNALEEARAMIPEDTLFYINKEKEYSYKSAKIIKNSTNKQHNFIILDKGSKDGVEADMGVISANGIVGVIHSVTKNYAYVTSFLNKSQSISAKIAKNNIFGPMEWQGVNPRRATLKEIPLHTDVVVGDTIVSSGFSLIFPSDIPLGTVSKIDDKGGTSLSLDVDLFLNYSSLQYVTIVDNKRSEELNELLDETKKK